MYRITCDGYSLLDTRDESLVVKSPKVKLSDNTVGEASFTIYKNHPYYDKLALMRSVFEISDEYGVIFRGRMTEHSKDIKKGKAVDLEGAMAFFNDSIVRPYTFPDDFEKDVGYIAAKESGNVVAFYLGWLIEQHNGQVAEFQQFKLGNVTVTDPNNNIERANSDYPNTFEEIKAKLFDSKLGGHICIRYEADGNYIDYLSEYTEVNTQGIVYGENLRDLSEVEDGKLAYSAIIPRGTETTSKTETGEDYEGMYGTISGTSSVKLRLTIADLPDGDVTDDIVKQGDMLYSKSAVAAYGWRYVPADEAIWDDVTLNTNLQAKGVEFLQGEATKIPKTIECKAVDLHCTDAEIRSFRMYKKIPVYIATHGINADFDITTLDIDLLNPQSTTITAGKTIIAMTDIQEKQTEEIKNLVTKQTANGLQITSSMIEKSAENIMAQVSTSYMTNEVANKKLEDYVKTTTFNKEISDLQSQIDGSITSWFFEVEPTLENEPAVNWTTEDDKNRHLGDLYYDTLSGFCYRWQIKDNTYYWALVTDSEVTKALEAAQKAQDTADRKRTVFVDTPTPPYDVGDLWTITNGDLMRCQTARASGSYVASDWIKATKYTDDTAVNNLIIGGSNLLKGTGTGEGWTQYSSFDATTRTFTKNNATVNENYIYCNNLFDLEKGAQYTLSFKAKHDLDDCPGLDIYILPDGWATTGIALQYLVRDVTTEYKQYSITFTPSGSSHTNCQLRIDNNGTPTSGTNHCLYIRDIKLEKGNKATDWTPAPEDMATNNSVDSKLTEYAKTTVVDNKIQAAVDGINLSSYATTEALGKTNSTLAEVQIAAKENAADISLVVTDGKADGSLLIGAINGESTAKIKADRLDIEGKKLNIKVDAANIDGVLTIGNLPSTVAEIGDIPTNVSELTNDANFTTMSAVENKGYQTAKQVTTITENTIKTTNVEAANLVVNAAKIKGTLTASQINAEGLEVVDGTFSGSITTEDITATGGTIGGFSIVGGNLTIGEMGEYASVHVRSSPPGVNVSVGGGTATGWLLTVGQGFGVTRSGTLWANNAHIQGEVIATSGKIGGVAIGDLASVDDIPTSISALVNDAGFTTMSEVEAMGYKTEGEVTQITKNTVTTAYVNALGISVAAANVTGKLTANQIDATNLKVSAANITGSLAIGQLPSNVAVEGDIPTDISDLNNDVGFTTMSAVEGKGYQTVTGVTSIIDGRITTDYIKALGLEVGDEIKMGANAKISWSNVTNQPTIPTSTSQLTNDSGYQNSSQVTSITQNTIETGDLTATNLKVNAANIQGTLTAGQINAEGLAVTNGTFSGSISVNNGAFKVTETGIVTATSGKIGAWTINSEELYTGKVGLLGNFATYNYDSLISGQSPIRIYAGSYTAADAPFKVLNDGSLYASAAEITGTIKANSGTIGILSIEDDGTLAYKKDMGVTDDDGNPVYTIPINITANKQSFSALSSDTFEVDNTITIGAPDDSFTSTAVYTAEQVKFTANGVTYRRKANGSTTTKTKTWAQLLA